MGAHHSHSANEKHSHNHGTDIREGNRKRLLITLVFAAGFMVVEFIGGILTGSLALIADAGHMLSDVAALGLSLFAFWMAGKPATSSRTYGFYRTEILAALFNGATLIAIAVFIILEAYQRFSDPVEVNGPGMMAIAAAGLAVNLVGLAVLHGGRESSLNLKGAYLHVLSDTLGSIGAVLAGAAVWLFGWNQADPIISAAIAVLIGWSSWSLMRQSVAVLMEGTPGGIDVDEIRTAIKAVPGVCSVHDLHVWTITSGFIALSAHAVLQSEIEVTSWGAVLNSIRKTLRDKFGIEHVTIQVEPQDFEESQRCT